MAATIGRRAGEVVGRDGNMEGFLQLVNSWRIGTMVGKTHAQVERERARRTKCGCLSDKWKTAKHLWQKPHPGLCSIIVTGRSSGLPSSFPDLAFPCVAQWRLIKVVRPTAAGTAPDWCEMKISRVTGFPFHPSAEKQKGTFHVLARILHANCYHGYIIALYRRLITSDEAEIKTKSGNNREACEPPLD